MVMRPAAFVAAVALIAAAGGFGAYLALRSGPAGSTLSDDALMASRATDVAMPVDATEQVVELTVPDPEPPAPAQAPPPDEQPAERRVAERQPAPPPPPPAPQPAPEPEPPPAPRPAPVAEAPTDPEPPAVRTLMRRPRAATSSTDFRRSTAGGAPSVRRSQPLRRQPRLAPVRRTLIPPRLRPTPTAGRSPAFPRRPAAPTGRTRSPSHRCRTLTMSCWRLTR